MFKQDVLILVNKGNRDALGLLLVWAYLRFAHKLRVKIESAMFMPQLWVELYRPKVVIYLSPDCPSIISFYEYLHQMGCKRLMYPTETIIARYTEFLFIGKYDYKTKIDTALLPSRGFKELLVRNGKIEEQQAYVVGNPVFDWCIPPLNKHFIHRREFANKYQLPLNRKWILLATSFDFADLDIINYDREYFHYPESKETILGYRHKYIMLRNKFIDCATEALKKHPEWRLLVKCHPMENRAVYDRAWSKHPQVTAVHQQDIYELLANTDALIHFNSTTSIQAWGFGKPTIHLDPCHMEVLCGDDYRIFRESNYVCHNADELESALIDCLSGAKVPQTQLENRKQFIDKWCYRMDGKSASRIADVVARFATQPGIKPACPELSFQERIRRYRLLMRVFLISCRTRIAGWLNLGERGIPLGSELNDFLIIRSLRRRFLPFLKKELQ